MKSIMFKGLILLVVMIPVLTGCSRKTVAPVVVPVHDTVYQNTVQHDSIFTDRWHTHYEYIKGDTLHLIDTFYTDRWRSKEVHDTTYISNDVPVPYEVMVEVEKKLNWWQKLTMWLGSIAIVGGIAIGGYKLWVKLR